MSQPARLRPLAVARPARAAGAAPAWTVHAALLSAAVLLGACTHTPPDGPATSALPTPSAAGPGISAPPARTKQEGVPPGIVSVTYADPQRMSDARQSPRESERARRAWLDALSLYLADRAAPLLAPDQRLDVRLADVQRAGAFEPGRGGAAADVRIVRDIYPPRIDLDFTLRTDQGRVLKQGRRQLRDAMFMARSASSASDPLRYEKGLIDDWLATEFGRRPD